MLSGVADGQTPNAQRSLAEHNDCAASRSDCAAGRFASTNDACSEKRRLAPRRIRMNDGAAAAVRASSVPKSVSALIRTRRSLRARSNTIPSVVAPRPSSRTCTASTAVLILTMSDQPTSIQAALRAGARGYLLKEASRDDIARTLDSVTKGQVVIGTGAAQTVRHLFDPRPSAAFPQLSERELDVLRLLGTGADNTTIARRLFIAEKTVRNRVSDILTKIGAATRAEAVARARDAGLGEHT